MNAIEPELAPIPAGRFTMGLPRVPEPGFNRPWHSGKIIDLRAFRMGIFAVTNREYRAYLRATGTAAPSHIDREGFNREVQPVGGISWEDAVGYCAWLFRETGRAYRLPTDAEWEYAARGGLHGCRFPNGDVLTPEDACFGGVAAPQIVGSFKPNGFGLFDMAGNVWQWCHDRFEEVSEGVKAGNAATGKDASINKVLRGGSYLTTNLLNLWCAYRHEDPPDLRHECLGFRVALSD